MDSEDELSPDPPLPEIPIQSRTLLHYFSKVKTQDVDEKSSSQSKHKTKVSEKSDKQSNNTSKSDQCTSNNVNEIHNEIQNGSTMPSKSKKQKRNKKNQEVSEDFEASPASKRVRAALASPDGNSKSKKDISAEEKTAKGINSFFATVSKAEYQKECEKQSEKIKLTVTAIVHTPEMHPEKVNELAVNIEKPDESDGSAPSTIKTCRKVRKRKCSFTNVIRPVSETDTIKVIEQDNISQEQDNPATDVKICSKEEDVEKPNLSQLGTVNSLNNDFEYTNGLDTPEKLQCKNQNKVSDKLFKRKKRKVNNSLDSNTNQQSIKMSKNTDDSVDVDFFNIQMIIPNENHGDKENIDIDAGLATKNLASPDTSDFQSSPKEFCKTNVVKSLSPKKLKSKLSLNPDINKNKKTNKLSKTVSERKVIKGGDIGDQSTSALDSCHLGARGSESEACKTTEKTPTPVSLFKHKDPPKKKYSKKIKCLEKTNAVNGIAHVNYDSDSIDLDLLATYNAKTFHGAASGEAGTNTCALDSSNDDTYNVFSALMKKPLTQRKSSPTTSPNNISNKLNTTQTEPKQKQKEFLETSASGSNVDEKDQILKQCQEESMIELPKTPDVQNAFVRLMSAMQPSNSNSSFSKKETSMNKENGFNDSLTDFVADSNEAPNTECLLSKTKNLPSIEKGCPSECLTPQTVQLPVDLTNSNSSARRSSSRIQRNMRLAEERKEEMKKIDISHEEKKIKSQRGRKKSLTLYKETNKAGLETPAKSTSLSPKPSNITKFSSEMEGQTKRNSTAAIFLIGKKRDNIKNTVSIEEDPEKLAARKAFLLSSVPQTLKDQVDLSKKDSVFMESEHKYFSTIGHIKQLTRSDLLFLLNKNPTIPLRLIDKNEESYTHDHTHVHPISISLLYTNSNKLSDKCLEMKNFDNLKEEGNCRLNVLQIYNLVKQVKQNDQDKTLASQLQRTSPSNIQSLHLNIKQPQIFPVNKIFRRYLERKLEADLIESEARKKNISLTEMEEERLSSTRKLRRKVREESNTKKKFTKSNKKASKGKIHCRKENCENNPEISYDPNSQCSMLWTIKYAPKSIDDLIGNAITIKKLQKWLGEWEERDIERKKKRRLSKNEDPDSSDAYSDDSERSSGDERLLQNTALIVGPNGIGKTATVYALAHEMGFKVLELNASSTRSGRQVIANLREATQSHSVKQEKSKDDCKQNTEINNKATPNSLVNSSETKSIDKTTVILFEDIDIVFEDLDEGFHNAINTLISTTKRPIVLTTSSQNFMTCNKNKILNIKCLPQIFEFRPIQPRLTARYLQLLCLVEGFCISYDSLLGLIMINRGNISASMHQLQYWVAIYGSNHKIDYNVLKGNIRRVEDHSAEKSLVKESFRPVEKEDSLAKLMSLNQQTQSLGSTIFSLLNCSLSLIGLESDTTMIKHPNNNDSKDAMLTRTDKNLFKLLNTDYFEIFDWSRHILLPFSYTEHSKRQARSTPYPLTSKNNNEGMKETEFSPKSYKRIIINDSLLMTESDENTTADESGELQEKKSCKEKIKSTNGGMLPTTNHANNLAITDECKNNFPESLNKPLNPNTTLKYEASRDDKVKSYRNAKKAMDILSEYTNCLSEFVPLQDDQPFWLRNNHKNSNCSSQLCANSNFYESYMKTNNFELSESYSSRNVDKSLKHQQTLAQDIIANVTHLTVTVTQNNIQNMLSNETGLLELSVYYPAPTSIEHKISNIQVENDKRFENLCIGPITSTAQSKVKCEEAHKEVLNSWDLICETSRNKEFERGFDDTYIKQLYNTEREVLQSFFPDPIVNIGRHFVQDSLPVIREMARLEEHRKASGLGYTKKRTSRSKFLHYFETQNLYTIRSETVLNTLCNSFQGR